MTRGRCSHLGLEALRLTTHAEHQRVQTEQSKTATAIHANSHGLCVTGANVLLECKGTCGDVVEYGGPDGGLGVRPESAGAGVGRGAGHGDGAGQDESEHGESDKTKGVSANVVQLEVCGDFEEISHGVAMTIESGVAGERMRLTVCFLLSRSEPSSNHPGVVDAAGSTEGVPEAGAVDVGVEGLERADG